MWQASSGELLHTFSWGAAQINSVAWSPDGALLAIGGDPIPRPLSEAELASVQAYFEVRENRVIPDYDWASPQVRLFDAHDFSLVRLFEGYQCGAFAPDGRTLVVAQWGEFAVLDLATGGCIGTFRREEADFRNIFLSVDGNLAACVAGNGVWGFDARSAELVRIAFDAALFSSTDLTDFDGFEDRVVRLDDAPEEGMFPYYGEPPHLTRFWRELLPEFHPTTACDGGMNYQRIAFSPDGKLTTVIYQSIADLGRNVKDCIALRDASTDSLLRIVESPNRGWLRAVAFSPEGRLLATAGHDKRIRIWELETGAAAACISHPPAPIFAVAVSPDGTFVAAGGKDGRVVLCESQDLSILASCRLSPFPIAQVEFSPKGDVLAAVARDGTVRVLGIPQFETRLEFRLPGACYLGGMISADGSQLVAITDSRDPEGPYRSAGVGEVSIWSLADGRLLEASALPEGFGVHSVSAAPNRLRLAIWSRSEALIADFSEKPRLKGVLRWPDRGIYRIAFAADSMHLLLAYEGYGMKIVNPEDQQEARWIIAALDGPSAIAVTRDGNWLVRATLYYEKFELFELASGKLRKQFVGHRNIVNALAVLPGDQRLISGGADGEIILWDIQSGEQLASQLAFPELDTQHAGYETE